RVVPQRRGVAKRASVAALTAAAAPPPAHESAAGEDGAGAGAGARHGAVPDGLRCPRAWRRPPPRPAPACGRVPHGTVSPPCCQWFQRQCLQRRLSRVASPRSHFTRSHPRVSRAPRGVGG
ncbi:hypothetical protein T484DRAFT_1894334, partial [Baffinella frigidus]